MFLIFAMILPLIWLPKDYVFISEEDNFANFQNVIYRNLYSWAPPINNGQPVTPADQSMIIPNGVFYYVLSQFNIPNHVIQKTYLSLMIFLTFISMVYFLKLFTRNKLIIFTGVLFYYFNFYIESTYFYSAKMPQLILMPLFFTFLYKYLESKKYLYAVLNFFSLFLLQSIFANLPTLLVTISVYPLAIIYFLLKKNLNILLFIRNYWLRLITFFVLILPHFLYNALILYFSLIFDNSYIEQKIMHQHLQSAVHLIFQFRGSWWEFVKSGYVSYNPWLWFYSHPLIVFLTFILIIISYSLFLEKNAKKINLFWLVVFLGSMFLASGTSFDSWILLFNYVPFFYVFREPWAKFTPLLLFAMTVLLVLSLENKKRYQKLLISLCLIFVLIKGAPFFSVKFINNQSIRWTIPFMKLPDYWQQYEQWSKTNQDKKVLSIPINYFERQWYKENIGNINHPLTRLFGYTHVLYDFPGNKFGFMLKRFINKNNPNFFKITSIDYILVQEDITKNSNLYKYDVHSYDLLLKNKLIGNLEKQFGDKLFLYQVKKELQLPQIYTAKDIVRINTAINNPNALDQIIQVVSKPNYKMGSVILFEENNKRLQELPKTIENSPSIEFKKINPIKYQISIKHAENNFILVFNESFNRYWKIYSLKNFNNTLYETWLPILNKNILPLSDEKHFLVNGYANAWLINTEDICRQTVFCQQNQDGSYQMKFIIEYWPQRLFYIVIFISGAILFGCLFYLIWAWIWERKSKNKLI